MPGSSEGRSELQRVLALVSSLSPLAQRDVWEQFTRHKGAVAGGAFLLFVTLAVLVGPWLWPLDPQQLDIRNKDLRPVYSALWNGTASVSWAHPFGTDNLGRDQMAQMISGGRASLAVGWAAMLLSLVIGTSIGVAAGFFRRLDGVLMRLTDLFLSLPILPLLLVAVTLIPALANRILGSPGEDSIVRRRVPVVDDFAALFMRSITGLTHWVTQSRLRSIAVVAVLCTVCTSVTWLLLPKLEYLPSGNRNLIIGYIVPPPGYNLDTMEQIARGYEKEVYPLLSEVSGPEPDAHGRPKLNRFFFVTFRGRTIMGAAAHDPSAGAANAPSADPNVAGVAAQRTERQSTTP